ncbi:hypothetical protein ACUXST_001140 [Sphingomonas sp. F9_3S_D5_B_2]
MFCRIAAALAAFSFAAPVVAQTPIDLAGATPLPGRWTSSVTADGSEATFVDSAGRPQLTLHCRRAARTVTIARPAGAPAASLMVWTSATARNLPSSFNPATGRVNAQISAYDSILDALAFSRGRVAVALGSLPALVAPAWPEIAHLVEDCRA